MRLALSIDFLCRTIALIFVPALTISAANATPSFHYVTPNASAGGDGSSWATAWPLSGINWLEVNPGDIIYLGAGVYHAPLVFQKPGMQPGGLPKGLQSLSQFTGRYITFCLAVDPGYVGNVIIDGTGTGASVGIDCGNWSDLYVVGSPCSFLLSQPPQPPTSAAHLVVRNFPTGINVGTGSNIGISNV